MCRTMEEMCNQAATQAAFEYMKAVAYRMLAAGKFSLEEISNITELPLGEIEKLQAGQSA